MIIYKRPAHPDDHLQKAIDNDNDNNSNNNNNNNNQADGGGGFTRVTGMTSGDRTEGG